MASYEDLFPQGDPRLKGPFSPIDTSAFPAAAGNRVRQAISLDRSQTGVAPTTESVTPSLSYEDFVAQQQPLSKRKAISTGSFGDVAGAFKGGVGQTAGMAVGIAEYGARQLAGKGETPIEQAATEMVAPLTQAREASFAYGAGDDSGMTPLGQERLARQWATLDPTNSIWRGGFGETFKSASLQLAQAMPSTLSTLLPGALMMRAGLGAGAITYLGASEGALSMGGIATNIAQEIEQAPESELMQSKQYQVYRQTMTDATARQRLIADAQGMIPAIGGAVVGAISAGAGRYLQPIFTDKPAGLVSRFTRGFVSEGPMQESPQGSAEQVAQNYAAKIYDAKRSLTQGVPEQALQGAGIGGIMGGGTAALLGPRPQRAIPPPPGTVEGAPAAPPPEDGPAPPTTSQPNDTGWDEYLQSGDQANLPFNTPRDEIIPAKPQTTDVQFPGGRKALMILHEGVSPDVAAALTASVAPAARGDVGEAGRAYPRGEDPQEMGLRQQNIPMSWGEEPPPPPPPPGVVATPGQIPLPMRDRQAGGTGLPPLPATPYEPDVSQPEGTYREVNRPYTPGEPTPIPAYEPPMAPQETVSKRLRGKAKEKAAALKASTTGVLGPYQEPPGTTERLPMDENQQDLFAAAPTPSGAASTPSGPAQPREITGYEAVMTDEQGNELGRELFGPDEGDKADKFGGFMTEEYPGVRTAVRPIYSGRRVIAGERPAVQDEPTAEPVADLVAQVEDLQDPDSPREGVYLSADNIANLTANGQLDRIRSAGPTLVNFDDKGGTVVAKNRAVAERLLADKAEGYDMQDLLGSITGAGSGKPAGTDIVVQQRDENGAVTRESLVSSEVAGEILAKKWEETDPGRETVILKAGVALKRRARLIEKENAAASEQRGASKTAYKVSNVIDDTLTGAEKETAERAVSGARTEEEAATRVARVATTQFRRMIGRPDALPASEEVEFEDAVKQQKYAELHKAYRLAKNPPTLNNVSENLKAKAAENAAYERAGAYLRLHKTRNKVAGENLMKAATAISPKAVDTMARARVELNIASPPGTPLSKTQAGPTFKSPPTGIDVQSGFDPLTDEEVATLDEDDLNVQFLKAVTHSAGREFRKVVGEVAEVEATVRPQFIKEVEELGFEIDEDNFAQLGTPLEDRAEAEAAYATVKAVTDDKSVEGPRHALYTKLKKILSDHIEEMEDMDPITSMQQILDTHRTVSLKQRFVKRVSAAIMRREHGGKLSATERDPSEGRTSNRKARPVAMFTLTADESEEGREYVRRVGGLYTGELTHGYPSKTLLESSPKVRAEFEAKAKQTYLELRAEIAKTYAFLAEVNEKPVYKEMIRRQDDDGTLSDIARDMIYAKVYLRSLAQYSEALANANYISVKPVAQAEMLAKRLAAIREYQPETFATTVGRLMRAEAAEQIILANTSRSMSKGTKTATKTKAGREASILKRANELRQKAARDLMLATALQNDADFRRHIGPFLRNFAEALHVNVRGDYAPSTTEPGLMAAQPNELSLQLVRLAYNRMLEGSIKKTGRVRTLILQALEEEGFRLPPRDNDVTAKKGNTENMSAEQVTALANKLFTAGTRNVTSLSGQMQRDARFIGFKIDSNGAITELPSIGNRKWTPGIVADLMTTITRVKLAETKALQKAVRRSLREVGVVFEKGTGKWNRWDESVGLQAQFAARNEDAGLDEDSEEDVGAVVSPFADQREALSTNQVNTMLRQTQERREAEVTADDKDRKQYESVRDNPNSTPEQVARAKKIYDAQSASRAAFTVAGQKRLGPTLAAQEAVATFRALVADEKTTELGLIAAEENLIEQLKEAGVWVPVGEAGVMGRIEAPGANTVETIRLIGPRLRAGELRLWTARRIALEAYDPIVVREETAALTKVQAARAEAQQRLNDRMKGIYTKRAGDEAARVSALTPEAQQLLRKYERDEKLNERGEDRHNLIVRQASTVAYKKAATEVGAILEYDNHNGADLNDVLDKIVELFDADSEYGQLARRLKALNMGTRVAWDEDWFFGDPDIAGTVRKTPDGRHTIHINRDHFNRLRDTNHLYDKQVDVSSEFIHTLLHEAIHAATIAEIDNDPALRAAATLIWRQARAAWIKANGPDSSPYGFQDVYEFVAEGFSNPEFQEKLRQSTYDNTNGFVEFIKMIMAVLKRLFGGFTVPQNSMEALMLLKDPLFSGKNLGKATSGSMNKVGTYVADTMDRLDQSRTVRDMVMERARGAKAVGGGLLLSALTMEQVRTFFGIHFSPADGSGSNPLDKYVNTFFQRGAANSEMLETADKLSRDWTALEETEPKDAIELSRVMTEATMSGVHVHVPVGDPLNGHVKNEKLKDRQRALATRYGALSDQAKDIYKRSLEFYKDTLQTESDQMTINMLRSYLTRGSTKAMDDAEFAKYTPEVVREKNLNTMKGMEAEFGDKLPKKARQIISRAANISQMKTGPYFPLKRDGDYVVYASMDGPSKKFYDKKLANAHRADLEADDPTLDVAVNADGEGGWVVSTKIIEYRMAETRSEAEQNRREMVEKFGEGNHVTPVQTRAQLYSGKAAIPTSGALNTILNKLSDNRQAQAAVKNYYLQSLSDSSFRKHEATRKNRAGVSYDRQHRNFGLYAKQSAYYISQLEYGWKMAQALQEMREAVAAHRDESRISSVRMAAIVAEINKRDEMQTDPAEVDKWVRKGVELSHFMLLSTPSYWLINATQPYTIALPWLAARYNLKEAAAAIGHAQGLIADPLLKQVYDSAGGLKALKSKLAAEKAFTVIEQVEAHIKKRGGERAKDYLDMITDLKRHSIIDLSFVAELRDIADGTASTWTHRVLDASRIMAHLTEVNNRVIVSLAAYELSRNTGADHQSSVDFAKGAVSTTQFNYSAGNKSRLFSTKGPFGKYSPLAFQFLQYPQHMYALLAREFIAAVNGGMPRKVAYKTLAGIFTTHLAAAGMIGLSLQPLKWFAGLILAAFSDDDDRWQDIASGDTFDVAVREMNANLFGVETGRLLSKGIPAALGWDLSQRMSLGTLYNFDFKADSIESFLGSVLMNFGGPTLGLATSAAKGASLFADGQHQKGIEMILPKFAKDASRLWRYSDEGLTANNGNTIIGAKDLSPWNLFSQAIGFQPTRINEAYDKANVVRVKGEVAAEQHSTLLRRYAQADTPAEKQAARLEAAEWSKTHPDNRITVSDLLKASAKKRKSNQRLQKYGVDKKAPSRADREAMAPYQYETQPTSYSPPSSPAEYSFKPAVATRRALEFGSPQTVGISRLYDAVEYVESRGNPNAVSPVGAVGSMQTMPATLRDPGYGVAPARNRSPNEMQRVGRDYLRAMVEKYGNLDHALAAYNWGPGNTDEWIAKGADPRRLPEETRKYIPAVRSNL